LILTLEPERLKNRLATTRDDPEMERALCEALKLLAQMQELATKRYVGLWSFARVHLALGEKEKAIDELERAYLERSDPYITFIKVSPLFDPLRGDPRFQALLAKAFSPGKK